MNLDTRSLVIGAAVGYLVLPRVIAMGMGMLSRRS